MRRSTTGGEGASLLPGGGSPTGDPAGDGVDRGAAALALAEQNRADHFEAVLLLGGGDVVVAARAWHHCAWHLVEFATGRFTDLDEWKRAVDANDQARAEFYRRARPPVPDPPTGMG